MFWLIGAMIAVVCALLYACVILKLHEWGIYPLRVITRIVRRPLFELFLIAFAMTSRDAIASNIQWNSIEVDNGGASWGYYSIRYPYVSMQGDYKSGILTLWAEQYDYMEIRSSWCVVNAGDTVSVESISEAGEWFYRADFATGVTPHVDVDYPIELKSGASVYLAAICSTYSAPEDYSVAWMELSLGDEANIKMVRSALDVDGAPLVVGAVPEPTAAMLLMLGASGLALRRKRER